MKLNRSLRVFALFSIFVSAFLAEPALPQAAPGALPRIGVIDESELVRLAGNRHPLASLANDRGEVSPSLLMRRMLLVLSRDAQSETDLQQLLAAQQDKTSANFHKWLTPTQFGERYGASPADLQKLSAWLVSYGFQVNRISPSGLIIEFSGTAGQVKQAFHTPIHSYVANGEQHYGNAADPQIPAALAHVVAGIATLHNFRKQPAVHRLGTAHRIANSSLWQPDFTFSSAAGVEHLLAPGDFAAIYNTAALYQSGIDGSGQSIAIVARNNINLSDVQIFRIAFGLPANDPQIILDGPDPGNAGGAEETEADLDIEWSGAIAPNATIKFVVSAGTNSTDGVDLSSLYIVDNNLAPVMSASFGECEQSLGQAENTFFNNLWEQAAAQGITVAISSGDNGPAGCDSAEQTTPAAGGLAVNGLASTPFNIAVGGTQFNENSNPGAYWAPTNSANETSALGYIPENVWNESCPDPNQCGTFSLFASSGGASMLYAKPSWQVGSGVPNDGKRDLPDVSLDAAGQHDGYLLCQDGICATNSSGQLVNAELVGGTSAAAPTFAAIVSLIVQKTNSRQGQANFVLYPLAAGQNAANCNASGPPQAQCIFNDVTQGNNSVPGQTGSTAGPGYDLATGWGSVNAANLAATWANQTFKGTSTSLQLTPTTITHGQPITATASVTPTTGSGTPTGDMALLAGGAPGVNLGALVNGSASGSVTSLPGGTYSVAAAYGGDGTFGASMSSGVPVTISPEPSGTTFTAFLATQPGSGGASVNTTYGNFLDLQVSVAGASKQGTPTGTLTFSDTFNGATSALTSAPLNSQGNATVQETQLALGTHTLSVAYSGDTSFNASNAGPVTVNVAQGPTQTILLTPVGALPNTSVLLEAIVLPNGAIDPTGTVQFFNGKTALNPTVKVNNLVASFTTTQLNSGPNTITATYSGDANFLPSASGAATVVIGNPDFQLGVNPGNLSIPPSGSGSASVVLSPGPGLGFAGPVTLSCTGMPMGSTCSFTPAQPQLNGFSPLTVTMIVSRPSLQASSFLWRTLVDANGWAASLAECALALAAVLIWPRKPRSLSAGVLLFVAALLSALAGCSHVGSTSSGGGNPSATSFVGTVTASGGSGAQAVSHSATFLVTLQ